MHQAKNDDRPMPDEGPPRPFNADPEVLTRILGYLLDRLSACRAFHQGEQVIGVTKAHVAVVMPVELWNFLNWTWEDAHERLEAEHEERHFQARKLDDTPF